MEVSSWENNPCNGGTWTIEIGDVPMKTSIQFEDFSR